MHRAGSRVDYRVRPGGVPEGVLRVPGDKSVSHRAVMLGAIADGITDVTGFLDGADCLATIEAFRSMGVRVEMPTATELRVHGAGLHGLRAPTQPLDLGNSGTSMRLLAGLLSAQPFTSELCGDASLSRRPMQRVLEPLQRMGADIQASDGHAPLRIRPVQGLRGIRYRSPVASAQVKSALLLAGLYAEGRTEVLEPQPSRDHTERMLQAFGVRVEMQPGRAAISGGQRLQGSRVAVPADISSAAFFIVAAAIVPGADLLLPEVGVNPTRTGILDVLRHMGARVELLNRRRLGEEPVADLRVQGGPLRGVAIGPELVASAIDEFPILFIAAACADGMTEVSGAGELRVKESDRIEAMCSGLRALGIDAEARADGARIRGGILRGGCVQSHGDHRVAMSFTIAGYRAGGPIEIRDCANVETSFPGFADAALQAGLAVDVHEVST